MLNESEAHGSYTPPLVCNQNISHKYIVLKILVDKASEAETSSLCTLFNHARADNGHFPKSAYGIAEFLRATEGEQLLVARIAGDIAGFASIWAADNFLHHLYVSPHYQRQGVGAELLKHSIRLFGLPMSLKCLEANVAACRFYQTQGWQIADRAEGPEGRYVLYVIEGQT